MLSNFLPSYDRIKNIEILKIVTILLIFHFFTFIKHSKIQKCTELAQYAKAHKARKIAPYICNRKNNFASMYHSVNHIREITNSHEYP